MVVIDIVDCSFNKHHQELHLETSYAKRCMMPRSGINVRFDRMSAPFIHLIPGFIYPKPASIG